jgi:hypothetical protein
MRRRILWITVALTMVFWFGQAWAEDDGSDGASTVSEVPVATTAQAGAPQTREPTPRPHFDAARAGHIVDRRDWPTLVVTPADGRVRHGPTWLTTKRPTAESMPRIENRFDLPTLEASLHAADAGGYSPANFAAIGVETGRLVIGVALLPVKMLVTEPLWRTQTTPSRESRREDPAPPPGIDADQVR